MTASVPPADRGFFSRKLQWIKSFFTGIPAGSRRKKHRSPSQADTASGTHGPGPAPADEAAWKEQALTDFKDWLAGMASDPVTREIPPLSITPDTCDFYSLLLEFTALKQEIKMQNREQLRTIKALKGIRTMTEEYQEVMARFEDKTRQITRLEQNIRQEAEKKTAMAFLDIRDPLARGREACREAESRAFFKRARRRAADMGQGYEMALRKFDTALEQLGILPVTPAHGQEFDPAAMKALETRETKKAPPGTVLETVSGGFKKGDKVLRYARVIVAADTATGEAGF